MITQPVSLHLQVYIRNLEKTLQVWVCFGFFPYKTGACFSTRQQGSWRPPAPSQQQQHPRRPRPAGLRRPPAAKGGAAVGAAEPRVAPAAPRGTGGLMWHRQPREGPAASCGTGSPGRDRRPRVAVAATSCPAPGWLAHLNNVF